MFGRDKVKQLTDRAIGLSKADEVSLSFSGGDTTHLRFARNMPSTSGTYNNPSMSITSKFGKRSGRVSLNQFDAASLEASVRRSEEIARLAPEDPEDMPGLGPQQYADPKAYFSRTADEGPIGMAKGVKLCIDHASGKGLVAAGFTTTSATEGAIANSKGLFGYHKATSTYVSETVRTKNASGSGWSSHAANEIDKLEYGRVSATAIEKAVASADPKDLAPGKYVTILEPACVASLIGSMLWSMDARRADEGRSFFSAKGDNNRLGEKLFPKSVSVYSDPTDPQAPATPWGGGGLPQVKRMWIDKGVVSNLRYDRFWADKQGKQPVPGPSNMIMKGGKDSVADLIKSTKQGVLVTSLWYIRTLDPRTLTYTGLTRDGVFWIENGKITHPVKNFRWNDSPISVLKNIDAISESVRVPARGSRSTTTVVPALRVKEFNFSSVSDAV